MSNTRRRKPDDARTNLPDDLSESLLAWVEGEAGAASAAERAMARDASLRLRMEAMREDAAALASIEAEAAPPGLVEAALEVAEPAIEREALLGLAEGRVLLDRPPKSAHPRTSARGGILRLVRPLALAAGLGLVVTISLWAVLKAGEAIRSLDLLREAPDRRLSAGGGEGEASTPEATIAASPARAPEGVAEGSERGPARSGSGAPDLEHAAALAAEGRLVIHVRAADVARALASLDARGLGGAAIPPSEAKGLMERFVRRAPTGRVPEKSPGARAEPVIASREGAPDLARRETDPPAGGPLVEPPLPEPEAPSVRLAVVRPLAADLGAMVAALEAEGMEVRLERSEERVLDPAPPLVRETVFWWLLPPREWGDRVRVPVVVEGR